ncbi:hypothetical protein [Kineosporia sp. A_224]|uniref:hypothetical protein n=1 Tax=Kineosporia sp. A_224 TaxID=1962180 RepID=UPI001E3DA03E|nr:hypothetical protein [Kineosporia sp. A_224]
MAQPAGVGLEAVQLDDELPWAVADVAVSVPEQPSRRVVDGLCPVALAVREPVPAFDVAAVAVLERGLHAVRGLTEDRLEQAPSPVLLPPAQCEAEPGGCRPPARRRPQDDLDGGADVSGLVGDIEHGLLEP